MENTQNIEKNKVDVIFECLLCDKCLIDKNERTQERLRENGEKQTSYNQSKCNENENHEWSYTFERDWTKLI